MDDAAGIASPRDMMIPSPRGMMMMVVVMVMMMMMMAMMQEVDTGGGCSGRIQR